jgi:fatty-acyl-CoA synthase
VHSTMQDVPLSIATLLRHGTTVHSGSEVATYTGSGIRRATFGEVGGRAAQLAHALRDDLGVTGDQRVATLMWNNQEHLEACLAIPAMGAVLHTLNLRLFPEQLAYIANHAEDHVIVVDGTLVPLLAPVLPEMHSVEHVVVVGPVDTAALQPAGKQLHSYVDLLAGRPETYAWPEPDERSAAAMCHTSGITAEPRGVVYSHRSVYLHSMQVCMAEAFGFTDRDNRLAVVPMFHVMSWGLPYAAFLVGASMIMPDRFLQAAPLVHMIEIERPTVTGAVPAVWRDILDHLDAHGGDVSSLREGIVGGSACPPSLMEAFEARYGLRLIHAWGMTETSPLGSVARSPAPCTWDEEAAWPYRTSQGRLPAAVQGRLVGSDGQLVPHDGQSIGELQVRGPWITGSYYRDEDPGRFDDGWLRTGDVGTISPDGYLTLTDRAKDVIKSGGEWISSVDLENHLMAHPAVLEASVVGIPDRRWGERPLAVVVLRPEAHIGPGELRSFLSARVPRWQVPERWTFVPEVPKTSVGKFDKKALRRRHAEGELQVTTFGRPAGLVEE